MSMHLFVCLSVSLCVTPLLHHVHKHMLKRNKGNQPEYKLEAQGKRELL
jgi:hypothetical protein